jgi:hypothetical protein
LSVSWRLTLPPWRVLLLALVWLALLAALPWWLGMPLLLALIASLLLLEGALTTEHAGLMRQALRWGLPGALIAMARAMGGDVLAWCMALLGLLTGYTLLAALEAWLDRKYPRASQPPTEPGPPPIEWPGMFQAPTGIKAQIIELQPPRWQIAGEALPDPRGGSVACGPNGYRFADGSLIEGAGTHAGFSPHGRWFVLGNGAAPGLLLWDRDRGARHRLAEWQLCGWQDEEPWLSLPEDAQLMSLHALLGRRAGRT